jgi:hypothetical protein
MSAAASRVGRDEGRRAAAEELSKVRYEDESLLDRIWRALEDWVATLVAGTVEGGTAGLAALAAIVVVLLVLLAALAWSLRRTTRGGRAGRWDAVGGGARTAAEHRAAAERFAAAGEWRRAIQERLRAVARTLEERRIVTEQPGRTADEMARDAGLALPELSGRLSTAARVFDAVTYGEDPGSEADYATLVSLDEAVTAARPTAAVP